jgi:drug/metabolite transporter (DMT)-like permease
LPVATCLFFLKSFFLIAFTHSPTNRIGPRSWLGLSISLAGVVAIAKPVAEQMSAVGILCGVGSAAAAALNAIQVRGLAKTESYQNMTFAMMILGSIISLPFAVSDLGETALQTIVVAAVLSATVLYNQFIIYYSYTAVSVTTIASIEFLRIVASIVVSALILRSGIDVFSIFGAVAIVLSFLIEHKFSSRGIADFSKLRSGPAMNNSALRHPEPGEPTTNARPHEDAENEQDFDPSSRA